MRISQFNNKTCLNLKDEYGKVTPLNILLTGTSGSGKGTATESIVERWKKTTGGVVIYLADPKDSAEGSFVMYEPMEKYHLDELARDRIMKSKYKCKLYHPHCFGIPKALLPKMDIFTLSIKDMNREDWSILVESDKDSESLKLLARVTSSLERNKGIFQFLHDIKALTKGVGTGKSEKPDPNNWYLTGGGGTSKSIKEIGNLLSPFKDDYFLANDICPYNLNWKSILTDSEPYHVFLSMWLKDNKLKQFMVQTLLVHFVENALRLADLGVLKKQILFVIPELIKLTPEDTKGYSKYLAESVSKALVTMRSQGKGISCLADTQIWSKTNSEVRASFRETFFGRLNPEDMKNVVKARSYTASKREMFEEVEEHSGRFVWSGHEESGTVAVFMPSHSHKEIHYNWVEMYKKFFPNEMRKYGEVTTYFRKEFYKEEKIITDMLSEQEKKEKERKAKAKAEKEKLEEESKPKKEVKKKDSRDDVIKKLCYEKSLDGISWRKIGEELGMHHGTAKKYAKEYETILTERSTIQPDMMDGYLGEGVSLDDVDSLD